MEELKNKAKQIYESVLNSVDEDVEYKMGTVETLHALFGTELFKDIEVND